MPKPHGSNRLLESLSKEVSSWWESRLRKTCLAIGLAAVLFYELARVTYRPYIYTHEINDFHIADTIGNSLGTIATVFVFVSLIGQQYNQGLFLVRTVVLSLIAYELAHPLLGKSIDGWDALATLITGILCEFGYRKLHTCSHQQGTPSTAMVDL